jgi:hypothetical protein
MKKYGMFGVVIACVAGAVMPTFAQSATWTNKTGGNWSFGGNWRSNEVPGPGVHAFLTNSVSTSYTVTNDAENAVFAGLVIANLGSGTNTLLNGAAGFNPAGNVLVGRNAAFDLNGFPAQFGGGLIVSNLGTVTVRGASLSSAGGVAVAGALVITNNGVFLAGSGGAASATNGGTIRIGSGGSFAASILTNGGIITTIGSGGGGAVVTGLVANLYAGGNFGGGGLPGTAGINVGGLATDATLSLAAAQPFLNGVNAGSIGISAGGTLNLGGLTAATSTASFTNRGRIAFYGGVSGSINTLNAGTLVNETNGMLDLTHQGVGGTNFINAVVVNYGAAIMNGAGIATRIFRGFPANSGTLDLQALASSRTVVQQGSLRNSGFINIYYQTTLSITNGGLINDTNGVINAGRGVIAASYFVQNGLLAVTNWGVRFQVLAADGVTPLSFTNNGTIRIVNSNSLGNVNDLRLDTLVNNGMLVYEGKAGLVNGLPASEALWIDGRITNALTGVISVQSSALTVIYNTLYNLGTINIGSNSVISSGLDNTRYGWKSGFRGGSLAWTNFGAVNLVPGAFLAAASLSNAVSGTISGSGHLGPVLFQVITNVPGGALTAAVQNVTVGGLVNAGAIRPSGIFNIGAITNLAGGSIIGSGVIQSINVTNFYDGPLLTALSTNVLAKIRNSAGAVILADGGPLVLENGFASNTQFGVIGATNGGVLRIGDGSLPVTNRGTISLSNGRLECGDLTVTNGSLAIDLDQLASATVGLVEATNLTLDVSSTLTLTGSGHRAVLIRYTGARSGTFGSITGLPAGYRIFYGPELNGDITLAPSGGSVISIW